MTNVQFRQWREKQGWNQRRMAKYLGVSQADVSRWEIGKYKLPQEIEILMFLYRDNKNIEAVRLFVEIPS